VGFLIFVFFCKLLPSPRRGDSHSIVIRQYQLPSQSIAFDFEESLVFECSARNRNVTFVISDLEIEVRSVKSESGNLLSWSKSDQHLTLTNVDCSVGERFKIE
jgi:hypothetical protein